MDHVRAISLFAIEPLWILHWRRGERLRGSVEIELNGTPVPRPILGIELDAEFEYLLVFSPRQPLSFAGARDLDLSIVESESASRLDAEKIEVRAFTNDFLAGRSLRSSTRLRRALIAQAPSVFPQLDLSTRLEILRRLAPFDVGWVLGRDGLFYVRFPWTDELETALLELRLLRLDEGRAEMGESERLRALCTAGKVHLIGRWQPVTGGADILCVAMPDGELVPLVRPPASETIELHAEDWMRRVLATSSDAVVDYLQAYLGLRQQEMFPGRSPQAAPVISLRGRLEGVFEGRLVGWAYDASVPEQALELRITIDGKAVGAVDARLPQRNPAPGAPVNCGFLWEIPLEFLGGAPHEVRIMVGDSSLELEGSPLSLGSGRFDGEFAVDRRGELIGWVSERCLSTSDWFLVPVLDGQRGAEPLRLRAAAGASADSRPAAARRLFRFSLPERIFDTQVHELELEISTPEAAEEPMRLPRLLRLEAAYSGQIESVDAARLSGWIVNKVAPERPVALELRINGRPRLRFLADQSRRASDHGSEGPCFGFDIAMPALEPEASVHVIGVFLPGTEVRPLGADRLHTPLDTAVRSLMRLAALLNERDLAPGESDQRQAARDIDSWAQGQLIARLIDELRHNRSLTAALMRPLLNATRLPERAPREKKIDVIVPVFRGFEDTVRCLSSVLTAKTDQSFELVVINDGSPEPELTAELRAMAARHGFALIENAVNSGFVATVNQGMRLHPGRDVVLLNSDTVVPDQWLDRLVAAARGAGNIGTVTPFSNNATICSFPGFCKNNPLPDGIDLAALDRLFATVNRGKTLELPTAVGFCMYIKRSILEEVGYFDETRWGRGYGEENDFCQRASGLGWRHVLACDVFVEHVGGVSFSGEGQDQLQANLGKLAELYPEYHATIQRFIRQDPVAPFRNRVAKELLRRSLRHPVLMVNHDLGGGAEVASRDLGRRLLREGISVLDLRPRDTGHWVLTATGHPYVLSYRAPAELQALVADLRDLGVWHIHFHQLLRHPAAVTELPERLGCTYDVTLHDYLALCPRVTMIDESGGYCEDSQFSAATCQRCIAMNGLHPGSADQYQELGGTIEHWRDFHFRFLSAARRVYAPSRDTADRFSRHHSLSSLSVRPHPAHFSTLPIPYRPGGDAMIVAVIGAIGPHKGYAQLLACVRQAAKDGLPLQFVIFGYTVDDEALSRYPNVTITGEYGPDDLPRLIESFGATVALFLSPWPETFSYTLSEAWALGLFPVALDIGAIAERIRNCGHGELLPRESSARRINQRLLEICSREPKPLEFADRDDYGENILRHYYGLSAPVEPRTDRLDRARARIGGAGEFSSVDGPPPATS